MVVVFVLFAPKMVVVSIPILCLMISIVLPASQSTRLQREVLRTEEHA